MIPHAGGIDAPYPFYLPQQIERRERRCDYAMLGGGNRPSYGQQRDHLSQGAWHIGTECCSPAEALPMNLVFSQR